MVEEAVELLAENRPGSMLFLGYSMLTHMTNSVQNVRTILTVTAILGNINIPQGIAISARPWCRTSP